EAGTVLAQDPEPGARLSRATTVKLVVETGAVVVPDVKGLPMATARERLKAAHLKFTETSEPRPGVSPEHIAEQTPKAGEQVSPDTTVTLVIAQAPPKPQKIEVPNVVRIPFEQAKEKLERANLKVAKGEEKATLEFAPGEVLSQKPEQSTPVDS